MRKGKNRTKKKGAWGVNVVVLRKGGKNSFGGYGFRTDIKDPCVLL
jgi:hypothetical protein